jgi:hypothetical protein
VVRALIVFALLPLSGALVGCDGPLTSANNASAVSRQTLPTISVDRWFSDSTHTKAIVRINNNTGVRGYRVIGIQCTFLNNGIAVDNTGGVTTNVAYGQTVFETLIGPHKEETVDEVKCRISYANE